MTANPPITATIGEVLRRTVTRRNVLIGALSSVAMTASARSAQSATHDPRVPVSIYHTYKMITPAASGFATSSEGPFTAVIGEDTASGRGRMDVNASAGIAHCKFTFVRSDNTGTLVLRSVCVTADAHGAWHVEEGTGRYKNFQAVGTETFGPRASIKDGVMYTNFEQFAGIGGFEERGDDEHGDDEGDGRR